MAWFALGRMLILSAVAYAAVVLEPVPGGVWVNLAFGVALSGLVAIVEWMLRNTPMTRVFGALLGVIAGLACALAIESGLFWANSADRRVEFLHSFLMIALPYIGLGIGARHGQWLEPARLVSLFKPVASGRRHKILDTSVIIDGRIADIAEAGFIDGTLVIPPCVLKELQLVADSSDSMKRNRGRRGLDVLQRLKKTAGVEVSFSDADFPDVRDVDLKLIELARCLQGKIVTNDVDLNKIAQLRGVDVLNVNALANALKPVVLPGELMSVLVIREGKEPNQGVAYLDDGTMVVVDNGRRLIGRTTEIAVTSVLQTTAGKMIFGRLADASGAAQSVSVPAAAPRAATEREREDGAHRVGASPHA
jgi:uncharacterized protein YacL